MNSHSILEQFCSYFSHSSNVGKQVTSETLMCISGISKDLASLNILEVFREEAFGPKLAGTSRCIIIKIEARGLLQDSETRVSVHVPLYLW